MSIQVWELKTKKPCSLAFNSFELQFITKITAFVVKYLQNLIFKN